MNRRLAHLFGAALMFAPLAALAHGGSDGSAHHGVVGGLLHPLTGIDHLVATLCVGAWSALAASHRAWLVPTSFVALLLVGAGLGAALPMVEPMIAASLLVLGLLVAARLPMGLVGGASVVGVFALFHGGAHGAELAGAASLVGMALMSALLSALGFGLGHALRGQARWSTSLAGGGVSLMGVALLLA